MKTVKISLVGTPHDYKLGLVPLIIANLGYRIQWVAPSQCDLQIRGPFISESNKKYRWLPKPARPLASRIALGIKTGLGSRSSEPLSLFHTAENVRHDVVAADYAISYDLLVQSQSHFRLPYWMEMVDWSHEGITGNENPRFGQLLSIARLMQPLGREFLMRPRRVAIFSSHLREPRATLVKMLAKHMELKGYGPYFDSQILDHHQSGINKVEVLQNFAFNLCPENGLYPGYYTEKIPEAFVAGCLPITWTDTNVCADFNPAAFINLEPMSWQNFEPLKELLDSKERLEAFADQPLILNKPTIEPIKVFIKEILEQAAS